MDSAQFRQLLGHFATGVTVITATAGGRAPAGMTANSLASVSLEPPLVSACVAQTADMYQPLMAAPGFVVNILEASQEVLSRRFADSHPTGSTGSATTTHRAGSRSSTRPSRGWSARRTPPSRAETTRILVGRLLHGGTDRRGTAALLPRRLHRPRPRVSASRPRPARHANCSTTPTRIPRSWRGRWDTSPGANRWFGGAAAAAVRASTELLDAARRRGNAAHPARHRHRRRGPARCAAIAGRDPRAALSPRSGSSASPSPPRSPPTRRFPPRSAAGPAAAPRGSVDLVLVSQVSASPGSPAALVQLRDRARRSRASGSSWPTSGATGWPPPHSGWAPGCSGSTR